MTDRITLSIHKQTFEELSELKQDGISWDIVLTALAREYKSENEKPPLNL